MDIQRKLNLQGRYTCESKVDLHEARRLWDPGGENLTKVMNVDQNFCRILDVSLKFKSTYHFQTYKQREVVNRRMNNILKNLELHAKMNQHIQDINNMYKQKTDDEEIATVKQGLQLEVKQQYNQVKEQQQSKVLDPRGMQ